MFSSFYYFCLCHRDMNITIPRKRITSSWGMQLRNWSLGTRNGERGISITMEKVYFTGQGQVCCLNCTDFPFCAVVMLSESSFGISWCINKLLLAHRDEFWRNLSFLKCYIEMRFYFSLIFKCSGLEWIMYWLTIMVIFLFIYWKAVIYVNQSHVMKSQRN